MPCPLDSLRILKDVHDSGLRSRAVQVEDGAERLEFYREGLAMEHDLTRSLHSQRKLGGIGWKHSRREARSNSGDDDVSLVGVSASAQTTRRNVLWIIDDDHSPYMMDPLPVTRRNIRDAGLKFASGSADVPLCGPARVGIHRPLRAVASVRHERHVAQGSWANAPWRAT